MEYAILNLIIVANQDYLVKTFALFLSLFGYYLLPKAKNRSHRFFKYLTIIFYAIHSCFILYYQSDLPAEEETYSNTFSSAIIVAIAMSQKAFTFFESLIFVGIHLMCWIVTLSLGKNQYMECIIFLIMFDVFQLITCFG